MIPDPLHPAIVHFPIVLAALAPFVTAVVWWSIRVGRVSVRAWIGVLALHALVVGSGWLALETGEREEERVERVVAKRYIEEHEETAERFLILAGLALALAAAGLLPRPGGGVARGLCVAASVAAALGVAWTGSRGGELVYRRGAASAYVQPADSAPPGPRVMPGGEDDEHEGDD